MGISIKWSAKEVLVQASKIHNERDFTFETYLILGARHLNEGYTSYVSSISFVFLVVGLIVGAMVVYIWLMSELAVLRKTSGDIGSVTTERDNYRQSVTRLEADLDNERAKLGELQNVKATMTEAFDLLANEAVTNSTRKFFELANEKFGELKKDSQKDLDQRKEAINSLIQPLAEKLEKLDQSNQELEKNRKEAYGSITETLREVSVTQTKLRDETGNLVKALRNPTTRGQWGEIQLRRIVELAGMVKYCDFDEQISKDTDGGRIRPDLIVRLPNERIVVIDAKTPLDAYMSAIEEKDDDIRRDHFIRHAKLLRTHVDQLSQKSYHSAVEGTPEFVVLFVPGEPLYSIALEYDKELLEHSAKKNVVIVTPSLLIGLLRAIDAGWRQVQLDQNAQKIAEQGRALYKAISTLSGHFMSMGRGLEQATNAYNAAIGSVEKNVLPKARTIKQLGGYSENEIGDQKRVETTPRLLKARELTAIEGQFTLDGVDSNEDIV